MKKKVAGSWTVQEEYTRTGTITFKNNKLLKCTMVLPKDGNYQLDPTAEYSSEQTSVFIECHQSPACNPNKLVSGLETVNLLGSLGAIGIAGVSVFTPLAPVVLTAALVTGIASGTWGICRSSARLIDRSKHKESLAAKETAGDWLTIASCSFGILSIGATKVLSKAVEKGVEISKTGRYLHDSITGGSLIMSGVSTGYRSFNVYKKETKIDKSDIFFLACEFFFLFNSVSNMKLAKNIIETQQNQMLVNYKNNLRSNRHRKAFKKLTKGTESSTEIIREINKIRAPNEFFAAIVKNGKTINAVEFSKLTLRERVSLVSDFVPANSTNSTQNACHSALRTFFSKTNEPNMSFVNVQIFESVQKEIKNFLKENAGVILKELIELGLFIVKQLPQNDTTEEVLASVVNFLWCKVKRNILRLKIRTEQESIHKIIIDLCISPLLYEIDSLISEWQYDLKLKYSRRILLNA